MKKYGDPRGQTSKQISKQSNFDASAKNQIIIERNKTKKGKIIEAMQSSEKPSSNCTQCVVILLLPYIIA